MIGFAAKALPAHSAIRQAIRLISLIKPARMRRASAAPALLINRS
jgi:hypothetical protein